MNPDLNSEVSALRQQVYVLLIALIVVSGTLTVFLYRQARKIFAYKRILPGSAAIFKGSPLLCGLV